MGCALSRLRHKRARCYEVDCRQLGDGQADTRAAGQQVRPGTLAPSPAARFPSAAMCVSLLTDVKCLVYVMCSITNLRELQMTGHAAQQPLLKKREAAPPQCSPALQHNKQQRALQPPPATRPSWTLKTSCSLGCSHKHGSSCQGALLLE